jgi:putative hemolysin
MRSIVVVAMLPLAGCMAETSGTPVETVAAPVGLANPASVYCAERGGQLEMRTEAGGEAGYCRLPDGRVVEEWELFRTEGPKQ